MLSGPCPLQRRQRVLEPGKLKRLGETMLSQSRNREDTLQDMQDLRTYDEIEHV
jgi:hypothetical protein